jgi:hypothetical protein
MESLIYDALVVFVKAMVIIAMCNIAFVLLGIGFLLRLLAK